MAHFRWSPLIGGAVAMLFGACSTSSGPAMVLQVNLPASVFERTGTPAIASVPFSLLNRESASVFVARCGDRVMAALDQWDGQRWTQYSGDACTTVQIQTPLELAPGASVAASRSVLEPGKYRLRIGTVAATSGGFDWSTVSRDLEVR